MWRNTIRLAWRAILRQRNYSLINLFGLAIGIAACLLLFHLVRYEYSFDRHHSRFDRIVRVVTAETGPEGSALTGGIPIPAMDAIQRGVPQFEQFARLHSFYPQIASPDAPGQKFATDDLVEAAVFIEPSFFRILDWQWLAGSPDIALSEPNTVVLTKSTAEKCFGSWQIAMGKTLLLDKELELAIRGIIADPPAASDFLFNLLVSYETLRKNPEMYGYDTNWGNISSNDQAWALLRKPNQFQEANLVLAGIGKEEYKEDVYIKKHSLQALADQHFDDRIGHFGTHTVTKSRLWVLGLIGLLILVMACFNFINLATAQASMRAREVGVRKTLGSSRRQLMGQFLGETAVLVTLAVVLGAGLASLSAPLLQFVSDVPASMPFISDPSTLGFLVLLSLGLSLLAGFYPAFVLAGFDPVRALKNKIYSRSIGGVSLRKVLVLLQFGIAQALIISTLVTVSQLDHIRNLDLGYQPELVYICGVNSDISTMPQLDAFRNLLQQIPSILAVSYSSDVPTSGNNWDTGFGYDHQAENAPFSTFIKIADSRFFETYGLRFLAGNGYSESDTMRSVVVNQFLLKKLGVTNPQEAIGKEIRLGRRGTWMPIVGVIQDFIPNSAREPMKPMAITASKQFYSTVGIKIAPQDMTQTTAAIQATFDKTFPDQLFRGGFLDESIAKFYREESRFSSLCKAFAGLAILISCLGLFGLASLLAAQKTKEIGIRKVLGASVAGVISLLSKEFMLLVGLAFLFAAPIAWWAMDLWLQEFVFRTNIGWLVFGSTVLIALTVAFLTISFHAYKAAVANPVDSLRNE